VRSQGGWILLNGRNHLPVFLSIRGIPDVADQRIDANDPLSPAINSLKSLKIEMTGAARRALAARCLEAAQSSAPISLVERIRRVLGMEIPRTATLAAAGMLVVLGVAVTLVALREQGRPAASYASDVKLLSISPDSQGRVTLEWRDGSRQTYTVLKSSNPRDFSRGQSYTVRGTRWTDPSPEPGGVTYYRVE